MLSISTRLGPYEIVAPLGAGGMGEVYRARDTRLGREVAIKVLPEPFANSADRRARFEREARAVAALSHPNILAIHDYGTEGSITYAVMELLKGQTLRSRLAKGPLPWQEAVEIGAGIADGLAAAHAKGIIHRDLKPENLFLTADGRVKILDFGLARIEPTPNPQQETSPYSLVQTDTGVVMGTAGYMSPEQVRGQLVDARSDLFSFGCVLYEMMTGRRAFQRETAAETMTAILHDEPPDPAGPCKQMPAELARLIRQCLVKNQHQRLHSARDLALSLRATVSDSSPQPSAPSVQSFAARRPSRRVAWVLAALVLAVLIGPATYLLTRAGNHSDPGKQMEAIKEVDAVAVLPFVYDGGDPKLEMLSETLPGHIIDSLAQVRRGDLKIRPLSSVTRFKRQRPDNPAIGRALNVPLIVTGILQSRRDDVTITVEVVETRVDNLLWNKKYVGKLGATLDLDTQDQIVRDVAANLGLRLGEEEQRRLTQRRAADPEAYRLYREAMYHFNKFRLEGLAAAIKCCKQAIERDKRFAQAYAGLARCYILQGTVHLGPRQTFPQARKCVADALKLDPDQADAHSSLGAIYLFEDWNWKEAEQELSLALRLDPNAILTWNIHGFWLAAHGRLPEALASIRRGQTLDPLAAARRNEVAMCYNWMRQHDDAIAEAEKALELDRDFPLAYAELGTALVQKGMCEKAIGELTKALERGLQHPRIKGMLGYAYAVAGKTAEAKKELEELKIRAPKQYGAAAPIARIYAALGEKDQAFEWLQRACDERDSNIIWLKVEPTFASLHTDPRFAQVLQSMHLQP